MDACPPELPHVVCLAGPTGCGKTALAVALADQFGCEIINADSRQVYADFPVITAQPSMRERGGIDHHLYGFLPTSQKISAGQWAALALEKTLEILGRGRQPLLVGGTGMYFQGLLHGLAQIPPVPGEAARNAAELMERNGTGEMHRQLGLCDPEYAAKIHPHDRQRIQRAMEVYLGTGKTFSWWHAHGKTRPFCRGHLLVMGTPLKELEPRLAGRLELMLAAGAVEEAKAAAGICGDEHAPGWSGIGCRELLAFIRGKTSFDQCRQLWLANTRAYAKRQITWFRGRKEAVWLKDSLGTDLRWAKKYFGPAASLH